MARVPKVKPAAQHGMTSGSPCNVYVKLRSADPCSRPMCQARFTEHSVTNMYLLANPRRSPNPLNVPAKEAWGTPTSVAACGKWQAVSGLQGSGSTQHLKYMPYTSQRLRDLRNSRARLCGTHRRFRFCYRPAGFQQLREAESHRLLQHFPSETRRRSQVSVVEVRTRLPYPDQQCQSHDWGTRWRVLLPYCLQVNTCAPKCALYAFVSVVTVVTLYTSDLAPRAPSP